MLDSLVSNIAVILIAIILPKCIFSKDNKFALIKSLIPLAPIKLKAIKDDCIHKSNDFRLLKSPEVITLKP